MRSKVAIVRTSPPTVLADVRRVMRLAGVKDALDAGATTIIKNNLSSHGLRKELEILWGPASLVPQPRDVLEMIQHLRWFVRLGPQPRFDHFTYWEKFDYWAVFWGMGIIGGSGLVLWFPALFSRILPGSLFNVALLVHREEALLAVGFIFTIHFFNSHLRPEKFPMDTVIFTGRIAEHELRDERPDEYDRLRRERQLEFHQVAAPAAWVRPLGRAVGTVAVVLGLFLVVLIVYAVLF